MSTVSASFSPRARSLAAIATAALLASGVFIFAQHAFANPSTVVINEFASDVTAGDSEWVELYNPTGASVDLANWTLNDGSGNHSHSLTGTIAPGGFAAFDVSGLNNPGDTITLSDNGNLIDSVAYGNAAGSVVDPPDQGESAGRYPDGSSNWKIFSTPTKGVTNGGPSATVTAEDFGTWDDSPAFKGINVGFETADFTSVSGITVDIYSGSTLVAENTASAALIDDINNQKDGFAQNGQLSSPFVISGTLNDTACAGGPCWTPGTYNWSAAAVPTKTIITVTGADSNGSATQTAENDTFSQSSGSFGSFITPPSCSATDNLGDTTFDTFTDGSVNGQNNWSMTGAYDAAIVDNTYGYVSFGCKSLRLSDAITSGSFGDWVFSAPAANGAGESSVASDNHFEAQFDIASTMLDEQPGLAVSVSPDDGKGDRMSYLRFEDHADGIHVFFDDATDATKGTAATWNESDVATLDRSKTHTVKFSIDFNDGPANDVVQIYIDGVLVKTGDTWEDYYRNDPEQAGNGNQLHAIDRLIFKAGGTPIPVDQGNGFLFDNVSISTSNVPPESPVITGFTQNNKTLACAATTNTNGTSPHTTTMTWTESSGGIKQYEIFPTYPDATGEHQYFPSGAALSAWIGDNFTKHGNGVYSYVMRAQGSSGLWSANSNSCSLAYDTKSPTAQFDPIPPMYVNGDFSVSGTASDNVALAGVFFDVRDPHDTTGNSWRAGCVSGTSVVTFANASTTANASCTIDTKNLTEGYTYTLRIHAGDNAGYGGGAQQDLIVDKTKPVASLSAPAQGSTQTGTFTITGNATDTLSGVDHIDIYVEHDPWSAGGYVVDKQPATYDPATGNFSYDVIGVPDGTYDIKAVVYDKAGNVTYALSGNSGLKINVVNVVPVYVTTNSATNITSSDATLNGTNVDDAAAGHSFWVSTSTFAVTSPNIPEGVYSTPDFGAIAANTPFPALLSSLNTSAVTHGGATNVFLPAITPGTTYYYVAWSQVNGTWHPGAEELFTTGLPTPTITSPTDGESTTTAAFALVSWTPVTSTGITYIYQSATTDATSTDGSFVTPAYTSGALNGTSIPTSGTPAGTYYLHVMAKDSSGNESAWSPIVTVKVAASAADLDGNLILVKHTSSGTDGSFDIGVSGNSYAATTTLATSGGMATSSSIVLAPGDYNLTEGEQDGWLLKSVSCDNGSLGTIANGESVAIQSGVTTTCTFTDEPATKLTETIYSGDLATSTTDVAANPDKWFAYNDTTDEIDPTLGAFVSGPNPAPLGNGSVQFTLGASPLDRQNIATYQFAGIPLSEITALSYSAYSHSGVAGTSESPFFNFNVDLNASNTWQGRLVYVPSANGSVPQNQWNTFDMIDNGNAKWTWSHFASNGNEWPDGNKSEYRTWSDIMAHFPNAKVLASDGWLGVRVGEPGPTDYTGNVDDFSMTVDTGSQASTVVADFEPDTGTETTISGVSPEPSTVGNAYTVSWKVTADSGATPTGTVVVTVNGGSGCSAAASAGSCQITPTSTGSADLVAKFSGDAGFDSSISADVTHKIDAASNTGSNSNSGGGGPIAGSLIGDINGDGHVNFLDFALLMSAMGEKGTGLAADLDNNGSVGVDDLAIFFANWKI